MLIAVRFALYLDLMLVFGLPLFGLYTLNGARRQEGSNVISPVTITLLSLAGAALSAFGLLCLAAAMSGVSVPQLDRATLLAVLDETAIGTAGKVRIAALLAALPVSIWLRADPLKLWLAQSCLGATALGSLAWTGHGAADEGSRGLAHLIADIVHLLAAGVWIGALAGLLILLLRARAPKNGRQDRIALAHRALVGFGTVGIFSVGLIVLTGLVNSWFLVGLGNISLLAQSLYGRLLVLKLLSFGGMLGLAALHRFKSTPAIEDSLAIGDAATAIRSIRWSVAFEAGLALSILALVAWLGTLAPPVSAS